MGRDFQAILLSDPARQHKVHESTVWVVLLLPLSTSLSAPSWETGFRRSYAAATEKMHSFSPTH